MGKVLLAVLIFCAGIGALGRPWIGINSYYLLAILGPQYIWWWNFQGLRVSFIIALACFFGIGIQLLKNKYDFKFLFNSQNFWVFFLWLCVTCSYFFGPYVSFFSFSGHTPEKLFFITNTIFLFYFAATLEINKTFKIRYLVIVFVISTIYLIYWANIQYFSQNWFQFNIGRLMGPSSGQSGSIYGDENAFAMLFVCGLPFIYYFAWVLKSKWLRWMLWAFIPLGWHAIFLTGSRGGLVGIAVTMVFIFFVSKRKYLVSFLFLFFFLSYQWQAGDVMQKRSDQIVNIEGENSAQDRITAWRGGFKMMFIHPVTGVGLGSFITALPSFVESRHMVAHNTFVQFAAESGLGAGLAYIAVIFLFFINSKKIRSCCHNSDEDEEVKQISLYNNASTASFSGLIVCSLFLSLNIYEIFFVLLLINNSLYQICSKKFRAKNENVPALMG